MPSNYTVLPEVAEGELRERLAKIKYVFTDLDATMLAPGSCVLRNNQGEPSLELVEAVVALAKAGIEVIPCSGRNRSMIHEDCRVLGLNSYIGEMGGLIMADLHANDWEYFTGNMEYDPACGDTPHDVIANTGVTQRILDRWPGLIEYHNDMANGYKYREVTLGMRGNIPEAQAQAMLDETGMALLWVSNGYLTHVSKPTTLDLPEGVRGRAYNIIPQGLNKGEAMKRLMEKRGMAPEEVLALGDSESDFTMAGAAGTFCLVENGLGGDGVDEFLAGHNNVFVTRGKIVDGWAATARTLVAVHGAA